MDETSLNFAVLSRFVFLLVSCHMTSHVSFVTVHRSFFISWCSFIVVIILVSLVIIVLRSSVILARFFRSAIALFQPFVFAFVLKFSFVWLKKLT